MANTPSRITLSRSQDIPFNRLVLSQANVRRVQAGISIEELAEDIATRTLLQSLNVRPVMGEDGMETGMYEVPAGGRRYRALELLVKQKRLNKTTPIPCIVREEGIAEEDSLAENIQRVALHPLDQFRAFQALKEKGLGEEDIAARFFVSPGVVRQRLKLVSVSPKLLDVYAADEMALEQLMAFTVSGDHERQEQVWEQIARGWNKEPYFIKKLLTENAVRSADRRARFVSLAGYETAGGIVLRDLFAQDEGGWLQDVALLDRLVSEKLGREAEAIRAEGWKWIEVAADFPYGHTAGLRRITGEIQPLDDAEYAQRETLREEQERLESEWAEADELPDEIDERLGEIETALEAFENRPVHYDPASIARAGVFVSIGPDGALRDALANDPDTAFLAVLHALALQSFYRYATESCLEITAKSSGFSVQGPDLKDCAPATAIEARREQWEQLLPEEPKELWDRLLGFDAGSRMALFAHCAAHTVNAVCEPWNRAQGRKRHADQIAQTLALDMAAAGWRPTAENYLGRVPKARICEAVREAKGAAAVELIGHLKKSGMAEEAERLLAGSGWLPEPLRMPGNEGDTCQIESDGEVQAAETGLPAFLAEEDGEADDATGDDGENLAAAE